MITSSNNKRSSSSSPSLSSSASSSSSSSSSLIMYLPTLVAIMLFMATLFYGMNSSRERDELLQRETAKAHVQIVELTSQIALLTTLVKKTPGKLEIVTSDAIEEAAIEAASAAVVSIADAMNVETIAKVCSRSVLQRLQTPEGKSRGRARYAIMGMAAGINMEDLHVFVRSLRAHMPVSEVDVFLFVDAPGGGGVTGNTQNLFEIYGITGLPYDVNTAFGEHEHVKRYHPSSYRWILIRDQMKRLEEVSFYRRKDKIPVVQEEHLEVKETKKKKSKNSSGSGSGSTKDSKSKKQKPIEDAAAEEEEEAAAKVAGIVQHSGDNTLLNEPPYDAIMLTDVRDVKWQGNPFIVNSPREQGLSVFLEARVRRISDCGWNSKWVKDCMGQKGVDEVGANWISCSGISMGSWDDAMIYTSMLGDYLESNPTCENNGVDQGLHNYFVYAGHLASAVSKLHVVENMEVTATIQTMARIKLDIAGRVVTEDGKFAPPVVHQYDRLQEYAAISHSEFPFIDGGRVYDRPQE